ncbi:MAG: hypothetical protein JWP02_686 [Acidimicrobiales bacterium]|nr:hypothetical protein [Acidimicrobiales bacterium]
MNSYIDEHLLDGEDVVYRTSMSTRGALFAAYVFAAFGLLFLLLGIAAPAFVALAILFLLIALVIAAVRWVQIRFAEFGVTDRRVLIKTGFLNRRSFETILTKVEGIGVQQNLLGKWLDYGTIVVTGTGGSREKFEYISDPFEFRKHVQGEISAGDDERRPASRRVVASARQTSQGRKFCSSCGTPVSATAQFCESCGTALA